MPDVGLLEATYVADKEVLLMENFCFGFQSMVKSPEVINRNSL